MTLVLNLIARAFIHLLNVLKPLRRVRIAAPGPTIIYHSYRLQSNSWLLVEAASSHPECSCLSLIKSFSRLSLKRDRLPLLHLISRMVLNDTLINIGLGKTLNLATCNVIVLSIVIISTRGYDRRLLVLIVIEYLSVRRRYPVFTLCLLNYLQRLRPTPDHSKVGITILVTLQ